MRDISSEAEKEGIPGPGKPVAEMTEEELMAFRTAFDADRMGFDGAEGIDLEEEGDDSDGSSKTGD